MQRLYSVMRASPRWGVMALVMLLSSCASVAPVATPPTDQLQGQAQQRMQRLQQAQAFSLEAKLAVQYAGKGYTARLEWQHETGADTLHIYSPLGQQVALIERTAASVTLTDQSGKRHQATDVAALTERLLGWRLPLSGLSQWVLGAAHAQTPFAADYLPEGVPATLRQDQWQISYEDYRATPLHGQLEQLPYTTRLQQQDVRLKLVIQHW